LAQGKQTSECQEVSRKGMDNRWQRGRKSLYLLEKRGEEEEKILGKKLDRNFPEKKGIHGRGEGSKIRGGSSQRKQFEEEGGRIKRNHSREKILQKGEGKGKSLTLCRKKKPETP